MEDLLSYVQAILGTTAGRWTNLMGAVPADLLQRPAAAGEWSAIDCLQHLLDTEQGVFPVRVRAFLEGEAISAFDPETEDGDYSGYTPEQLAAHFAKHRAESLALLGQLTPADLERSAVHSELGEVTLGQMLNEWAAHDLMHTVQAERALLQPFAAGSGPWRSSFADHDLGGD